MSRKPSFIPQRDEVFVSPESAATPFHFDEKVAAAFDDMAHRSIPGYEASLGSMEWLARDVLSARFSDGRIYDLGASTGAFELRLAPLLATNAWQVVAVDLSAPMLEQARVRFAGSPVEAQIEWRCEDVRDTVFDDAVMVVSNYCLQFVAAEEREGILQRAYEALRPGGFLVLSEKTYGDSDEEALFVDRYDAFKRQQGYSEEEIRHKRQALQGVLVPWSVEQNEAALRRAGFSRPHLLLKHWNFCTWIAEKTV